jgi:hypothetical protein
MNFLLMKLPMRGEWDEGQGETSCAVARGEMADGVDNTAVTA